MFLFFPEFLIGCLIRFSSRTTCHAASVEGQRVTWESFWKVEDQEQFLEAKEGESFVFGCLKRFKGGVRIRVFFSLTITNYIPGVTKECFLEVFKYLKTSKKHPFVTPGMVTFFAKVCFLCRCFLGRFWKGCLWKDFEDLPGLSMVFLGFLSFPPKVFVCFPNAEEPKGIHPGKMMENTLRKPQTEEI